MHDLLFTADPWYWEIQLPLVHERTNHRTIQRRVRVK